MNYCPVILLGNGIRNNTELIKRLCSLNIPVLLTWPAMDCLDENDSVYCGRPGILGQRAANIIQQKATHLYCFGARLDGEQVFYDYNKFAPNAIKYVFDIDENEYKKFPKSSSDWFFFRPPDDALVFEIKPSSLEWLTWCKSIYTRFRPELDGGNDTDIFVDPFTFMRLLSDSCKSDDVLATGSSGNAATIFMQTFKVKKGQRVQNVSSIGSMGADIPMALGAAVASGRRTICVTGDGGFHMNAQELEIIHRLRLPITFFVVNNNGYASIRNNQDVRFEGRHVGCDPKSGMTLPKLEEIADAYGLMYKSLRGSDLSSNLDFSKYISTYPAIVEVFVDPDWVQYPRCIAVMKDGQFTRDDMSDMTPKIEDLKELMAWGGI